MTAKARNTDPQTSHDAAKSVKDITLTKHYILKCLVRARTDVELVEAYGNLKNAPRASESGIRSRRAELVREGYVSATGLEVKLPSGRFAKVWQVTRG